MKEKGKLLVRAVRENEYVLVEIADDGPGIPPEVQSRIFEPFFTTKGVGEGTGLGLDVVHRIVQKMRGLVTVKSVPDRKSTRLNSSHSQISYAVFCLKKKKKNQNTLKYKNKKDEE